MGCTFKFSDGTECGKPVHSNTRECLLHWHHNNDNILNLNNNHLAEAFEVYISQNKIVNLSNLRLSNNIFDKQSFPKVQSIVFKNTTFQNCKIDCSLFPIFNNIKFKNCEFENTQNLNTITDCTFEHTTFEKLVFEGCYFNFTDFKNCTFKNLNFNDCRYGGCSFEEVTIDISSEFKDCTFNSIKFIKTNIMFTVFVNCSFISNNNIENTRFINVDFYGISFVSKFNNTEFKGCEFEDRATFGQSDFRSTNPIFNECNFNINNKSVFVLSFDTCKVVVSPTMFENCSMSGSLLNFNGLDLECDSFKINNTDSIKSIVRDYGTLNTYDIREIRFSRIKFNGHFKYNQYKEYDSDDVELDFTDVDFDNMDSARIINTNLEKSTFKNSSIEKVKFHNCKWEPKSGFKILNDEVIMNDKNNTLVVSNKELLQLYVQLKKNFEASGNMIDAGDWYYREMETRRRSLLEEPSNKKRNYVRYFLKSLYKWVSSYGESYLKPLIGVFVVLLLFSIAYFYSGFIIIDPLNSSLRTPIEYNPSADFSIQNLYDFGHSLLYSVSVMTFQASKLNFISYGWTKVFNILHLLCTAILLPLFLLALRRKFKR